MEDAEVTAAILHLFQQGIPSVKAATSTPQNTFKYAFSGRPECGFYEALTSWRASYIASRGPGAEGQRQPLQFGVMGARSLL